MRATEVIFSPDHYFPKAASMYLGRIGHIFLRHDSYGHTYNFSVRIRWAHNLGSRDDWGRLVLLTPKNQIDIWIGQVLPKIQIYPMTFWLLVDWYSKEKTNIASNFSNLWHAVKDNVVSLFLFWQIRKQNFFFGICKNIFLGNYFLKNIKGLLIFFFLPVKFIKSVFGIPNVPSIHR